MVKVTLSEWLKYRRALPPPDDHVVCLHLHFTGPFADDAFVGLNFLCTQNWDIPRGHHGSVLLEALSEDGTMGCQRVFPHVQMLSSSCLMLLCSSLLL